MNNNEKTVSTEISMKLFACFMTLYLPMVIAMKYLSPLFYGAAATRGVIAQSEMAIVVPGMMIGMGFMAIRASSTPLKNLLVRCLVTTLLISCMAAAVGVPIFQN
jgi:hypothetical protein